MTEFFKGIDVNIDDNNDGQISDQEKSPKGIQDELDNLGKLEQKIVELKNQYKDLNENKKRKLYREISKRIKELEILAKYAINKKLEIFKIQAKLNNIPYKKKLDFNKTNNFSFQNEIFNKSYGKYILLKMYNKDRNLNKLTKDELVFIITNLDFLEKELGLDKKQIFILLQKFVKTKYGDEIFDILKSLKKLGFNKEEIFILLQDLIKSKNGSSIFYFLKDLKEFGLDKEQVFKLLQKIIKTRNGSSIFYYLKNLKEFGFNKKQIFELLQEAVKTKYGNAFFYKLKNLKEFGFNKKQIFELLQEAVKTTNGYMIFFFLKNLKELGLDKEQIFILLQDPIKTTNGYMIFNLLKTLKELGLDKEQIFILLQAPIKTINGYMIFYKFKDLKNVLENKIIIKKILNLYIGLKNGFKENFIDNFKVQIIKRFNIFLGKNFEKYKKDFKSEEAYKKFIEKILKDSSEVISYSLNDIYDFYEEKKYPNGNDNDEAGAKTIKGMIKENLKKYSTEELFSSLGNHSINYSTTFKLVLQELDKRIGNKDYFEFINSNKNLNENAKIFLKGQIIAGLSARGQIKKVNNLIKKHKESFGIIKNIIDYKNIEFFGKETYLGLMIGLKNILEKNNDLIKYIFSNEDIKNNNKFIKVLKITFLLEGKEVTINGIKELQGIDTNNPIYKEYLKIKEKYLINTKEIFNRKVKDVVYVYGGTTEGGGLAFYQKEINIYLEKYGYKEIKKGNGYILLEKNGIRVTFINNDELEMNLKEILKENKINPILISFRGHNYKTSEMIINNKDLFESTPETIIVDGGCRNISKLTFYRKKGINNQIVAYTSTGKGDATNYFTGRFISNFLRKPKEFGNTITLKNLSDKILDQDSYAKTFMKFPGDLLDIILEIEFQ